MRHLVEAENYPAWRTRTRRRALVLVVVAGLLGVLGFSLVDGPVGGLGLLASMVVTLGAWFFLRHLVRALPDLPDEALDERQVLVRGEYYRQAFILLGALCVLAPWVGGLVLSVVGVDAIEPTDLFLVAPPLTFLVASLPTLATGWCEPDDLE